MKEPNSKYTGSTIYVNHSFLKTVSRSSNRLCQKNRFELNRQIRSNSLKSVIGFNIKSQFFQIQVKKTKQNICDFFLKSKS